MSADIDREILRLFHKSNSRKAGFALLVNTYQKQVYWHVRRMVIDHDDTNDITQDIFIKIWNGLEHFREESRLYTWIYRLASNEALSFLKKRSKMYLLPLADVENRLAEILHDDNYFTGDEIQHKLQQAILKLPRKQRLVFNMKYYDGIKYEEMSQILKTSVGALKASYHHAVKKIEKYMSQ